MQPVLNPRVQRRSSLPFVRVPYMLGTIPCMLGTPHAFASRCQRTCAYRAVPRVGRPRRLAPQTPQAAKRAGACLTHLKFDDLIAEQER